VKQTPEGCEAAAGSALIGLIPAPDTLVVPEPLRELARESLPVIEWSTREQQLRFLQEVQQQRDTITTLRREPLLADAQAALQEANQAYNEMVFVLLDGDSQALREQEARLSAASERVGALQRQFDHEGACSLGPVRVVGVAAVFALVEPPDEALVDERPSIAAAAEKHVIDHETRHGRPVTNVSGEHDQYPYDLHSEGPGGTRCIEVKGTTTGKVLLSEPERRAAMKLGQFYYLYIVVDPLGEQPRLTIIRDPLARMDYDGVLYSGARYVYSAATWRGAADEEIAL
jgi:hypothetical protein